MCQALFVLTFDRSSATLIVMDYNEILDKNYSWFDDSCGISTHKVPLTAHNPMTHQKKGRKYKPPSGYLYEYQKPKKTREPKINKTKIKIPISKWTSMQDYIRECQLSEKRCKNESWS